MAFFLVFGVLVYFVQQQKNIFYWIPSLLCSRTKVGKRKEMSILRKAGFPVRWWSAVGRLEAPEERQLCQEAESWCGQRGKRQQEEGSDNSEASTAGHTKIFGQICPTVYGIGGVFPKSDQKVVEPAQR